MRKLVMFPSLRLPRSCYKYHGPSYIQHQFCPPKVLTKATIREFKKKLLSKCTKIETGILKEIVSQNRLPGRISGDSRAPRLAGQPLHRPSHLAAAGGSLRWTARRGALTIVFSSPLPFGSPAKSATAGFDRSCTRDPNRGRMPCDRIGASPPECAARRRPLLGAVARCPGAAGWIADPHCSRIRCWLCVSAWGPVVKQWALSARMPMCVMWDVAQVIAFLWFAGSRPAE
jgi:hypothetical protein